SVYVLGANMLAIGPELPHTVAVYVGDGTMAEVGVRAAELHRMIMQAHPDQSVTVIGCTASGHDGSGLALQLAGLDGELGYRATVAHVSAPRIHLIGEGLDGAATAAAAAVHGRLQYLAASLTLVDPPAGMDHSQYYVPAHFMSRDGVPAPPLGGGRRLGWSAGTFADIVAGNGDVVPALPDPNLGRPGPREVNELFDYRRWPTARHPTGEQVAQAEAAWRTCPTRDLPTDPREVAAVGRSQGTEVAAWWNSLGGDEGFSAAQIGLLRGEHGAQLARMEGLPPEVRDAANRIMLRRWIAEEWDNPGAADGPGLSDYLAYKDLLDAADAEIATVSECREHAYLLTLDLNRTSADAELRSFEIAFGDPAAAHTIGMHLLAPRSGFRETAGVVPEALGHYANLTVLGDGPVSVVVRMYSAPVGDVPHQTRSVGPAQNFAAEGRRLACDIAARQAASQASAVPATHLVAHGSAGAVVGYAAQHGALADAGVARLTFRECETAGPAGHRADLGVGQVFAQSRATDLLSMMEAEFGNNPGEVEPGKADFDARALGEGAMPVELAMISAGLRDYDPAQPTGEQLAGRMQTAMADGVPSDLSGRTEAGPEAVRSGVEAAHDGAAHIARTWDAVRALGLSEEQASRAAAAAADAHNTAGVPWDVRHARHRRDLVAEVADLMHVAAGLPGAPQVRVLHHDGGVPGTMLAFGDPVADSVAVVVTDRGLRDGAEHAAEVYRMAKSADPDRSVTVIVALGNDGTEGRHGATAVAQRIAGLVGEARYRALDTGAPLPQVHVIGEGRGAATVSAAAAQQNLALFVDSLMFVDPHGLAVHADSYGVPVHMAFRSGGESSEVFGGKHIGWNADNVGQVVHGRGDTVPALDSTPPAATSFESGTPWPAHDPSFEPADDGLGYYSRPDLGHHGHADLGTPNDCAVGGSEFLSYWHPGNPEIRPIEPSPEIWLSGVEPAEFAQSVGADWSHRFGSLDDAARYVLKHGGTVTVGVEFHGLADRNNGVGAHIAVFHRSDDGRILVYEKRNGEATSYFHRFGPDAASVKAIYAIVHNQDGSAYQSLADGRSQAVAGLHMPDTNLGAPIRVGDDSNSDAYFDSGGLLVRHPQTSDEVETATVTGDTRPQFPDINTGIHQFRL
ncbi:MAG: hypothetical protein HOQ24_19845, partial [Mycobacteriaceae bacterium]|nr:hypothetical protein [Mycobacteriaceae bacterium]